MRLSDIGVLDIVILIYKIFLAIGVVSGIYLLLKGLSIFFNETVPAIFIFIWKGFSAIGFQSSWWNFIPFMAVFVYGSAAILAYISLPHPNAWLWWEYATTGVLIFCITLALNIYLKPKSMIQEWHVTPTPEEWPPIPGLHLTPTPKELPSNKVDPEKLKKWREYK